MSRALFGAATIVLAALLASGCRASAAAISGDQLYRGCVSCHGTHGEGTAAIGAPRIAGMPQWYVAAQLQRFQSGIRGKHPDDAEGLRMRAMSQQMMSPAEIDVVASHVAGLAPVTNPATLHGVDLAAGQAVYSRCVPCHGVKGEGNEQVKAPPLAGLDDWYAKRQIQKFRAGIRGRAQGDTVGPAMQAMTLSLDETTLEQVAAYIHSVPR